MAHNSPEVVAEVKKLLGQRRSVAQIIERLAKKAVVLTTDDVAAIKTGINTTHTSTPKEELPGDVEADTAPKAKKEKKADDKPRPSEKAMETSRAKSDARKGEKKTETKKVVTDTVDAGGGFMVDIVEEEKKADTTPAKVEEKVEEAPKVETTPTLGEPHPFPLRSSDGAGIYNLSGVNLNLFALLTPEQAAIRNSARKDDVQWKPVKADAVPKGVGVEGPDGKTIKEATPEATVEKAAEPVKEKKADTTRVRVKVKDDDSDDDAPATRAPIRPDWKGLGMCEFLRYIGKHFTGLDKRATFTVAQKCGWTPRPATLKIQTKRGATLANVYPVPEVKKDIAAEIKMMVEEAKKALPKEK